MDLLAQVKSALGDRYAVEREVGRGGMAVVFLAQDRKHRRPVAVKVIRPEVAEGIGADRFLREIETAARLTHPHILPLHDSGQAGGILYYVMRTLAFSDSRTNHVHRPVRLWSARIARVGSMRGARIAGATLCGALS